MIETNTKEYQNIPRYVDCTLADSNSVAAASYTHTLPSKWIHDHVLNGHRM